MQERGKVKSKEEKNKIFTGKKTKRQYTENPTNDSSFPDKAENESEKSLISENSEKKSIYVNSLDKIKKTQLENIFSVYGKIEKIIINKKTAVITFSKRKYAKSIIDNKTDIYEKYKLRVGYKSNEYDDENEKENEPINIEESLQEDEIITTEKKSKPEKNKKKNDERKRKESNNSQTDNSIEIINNKTNIKSEFSEKLLSLEETVNKLIESDKKIMEENKSVKTQLNNLNDQIIEMRKKNTKIVKLLGIMGEINVQKEKYLTKIELKLELILNSYKILYIRKLANIILSEIFKKYKVHFKNEQTSGKNHVFTVCVKSIKGINKDIITLIVDFLRYIKYRISQIIHIQDNEIQFNREILTEYLDTSSKDGDSFTLNEASTLIFKSDLKKEKQLSGGSEERYKKLNNILKEQLEKYNEEEEEEQKHEVSEGEEEEEDEEKEEKRIKNILNGDEKYINMSIKVQINHLLNIIKKNQLEKDNKYNEIKKIDGKFLYEEWKKSFSKEHFKKDDLFLKYVHPNKCPTLANMGYYINNILDDL